ncbi:DNA-3-methyladenine glycosylase [Facilibium subflavum]|uniref:DNA-3-methyladenine glycosylase n=1 Tax=Facilibium subflavum TaxID=2219058 RepID=UPI000E656052|nr:DNA-3-methyladenine glycosylase [Facilibium subflavum]
MRLTQNDFNQPAVALAKYLLGKVICHNYQGIWLKAQIIETESYELEDKASHASLGFTEKRKALFMPPGTIYMYYARGGDSLNASAKGAGNAVLIKSAIFYPKADNIDKMLDIMHDLNPLSDGQKRQTKKLLSGQTLLCKALGLKVKDWDQQQFNSVFFIEDAGVSVNEIIQTTRLGIATHRDADLLYRFIDKRYAHLCTKNPLTVRRQAPYLVMENK